MKKLERDRTVAKWTKNHGIAIQYVTEAGNVRGYHPDFLLERVDGTKELHEIKGRAVSPKSLTRSASTRRQRIGVKKRAMSFVVVTK